MFDLKTINAVLEQLEQEKGIPREKIIEAIGMALASAYKKEYGQKGQIIKADFDINTGTANFSQIKIVVDDSIVRLEGEDEDEEEIEEDEEGEEKKPRFNQKMILVELLLKPLNKQSSKK